MLEQSENTNKAIQNELKLSQTENNDLKVKNEKFESTCERRQQDLEKIRAQHRHTEEERDKLSIKSQDADGQLADYKKRYEYAMDEITQANKATEVSPFVYGRFFGSLTSSELLIFQVLLAFSQNDTNNEENM